MNISKSPGTRDSNTVNHELLAETSARNPGQNTPKQGAIVKNMREKSWKGVKWDTYGSLLLYAFALSY
jgi:hypothetical protein